MKPRLSVITLGVDDLERALAFYRDGLGLESDGIVGTEFEHGAVAFFELEGGARLALWSRRDLAHDSGLPIGPRSPAGFTLGHNVASREEVDAVMQQARSAGATLVKAAQNTFWGGYAGYFEDPDGHLWEVVWNPDFEVGRSGDLGRSLSTLLSELVYGAPEQGTFVLNPRDPGLLHSLGRLSARAASVSPTGGASIAAHVDHLRYGLSLLNRWAAGENPFRDADWAESWERTAVSETEWAQLRDGLKDHVDRWHSALEELNDARGVEVDGAIASVVHLAYHLGAIRQIDRTARGPSASEDGQ